MSTHYLNSAISKPACRQDGDSTADLASVTCLLCRETLAFRMRALTDMFGAVAVPLGQMLQRYGEAMQQASRAFAESAARRQRERQRLP